MYVSEFNKTIQSELSWIFQEYKDIEVQNEVIARRFLYFVAKKINQEPCDIEFANESKKPVNHFQMYLYLENGYTLHACMIHVDNKKVVAKYTNLQLLDENYDTIKVICKRK